MKSLKTIALTLSITSSTVFAAGFHTCEGKVLDLVTRATPEMTDVSISGMRGWAKLRYGGDNVMDMRDRQFSMLLAAQLANKPVILEFEDSNLTCSDDHRGMLIRYVRIKTQ
jgi:hypothetical protein